ncbi:MAG: hypothetical protein HXY27_06915 [Hydrogenophilaceae bacterium]|nr:hypothetical protein [Hydrogenophilaceae bacterium]
MDFRLYLLLLVLPLSLLAGCTSVLKDPRMLIVSDARALQPMEGFVPLPHESRVFHEPGAEAYARRVASLLDKSIKRVEAAHNLPFAEPVRIFICGTEACFKRYVLTPKLSAAVIPDNRLILSPNLNERESWRLEPLMLHELSHLHLGQRVGHYHSNIPVWFHEGWASLTADGGGAEFATDEQAFEAAQNGKQIDLGKRDIPGMRHKAASFDLNIHVFYRQAMLLVKALKQQDAERFRRLTLALQNNQDFEIAFWDIYGAGPQTILADALNPESADNKAAAPAQ